MPPLRPAVAVPLWVGVEGETVTSNELVERLHRWTRNGYVMDLNLDKDLEEAADEIERLRYEIMAKDTEWQLQEQLKDKALAELDNERSAMRNVQECAESYRRERDGLKEMNAHLSRGNATLSVAEHKLTAENERLRGALHEARHVMRWEIGYQDGDRNIANADKVCAKIDSLIGVADETKP